jgi:hypothetical protein
MVAPPPNAKDMLERRKAELLARMSDKPEFAQEFARLLELLPSKATSESAPTSDPPQSAPPQLPLIEAAIRAAIAHTFAIGSEGKEAVPDQIQLTAGDESKMILANATPIMIGGQRRLQLTDEARADLLQRVSNTVLYSKLLSQAVSIDQRDFDAITNDPIRRPSAWLRSFLAGSSGDLRTAPPTEVRAGVEALQRLRLVSPSVVRSPISLPEARRLRELSDLLEPLRVLIGAKHWQGGKREDRFVGRDDELRRLRGFVDELASEGFFEAVTRGIERTIKGARYLFNIRDESVFFIEARGGLGKSTLIAKFVLDHAMHRRQPFPFVYLDFDRSSLQPRDNCRLLIESARQVGLQFAQISGGLDELCQNLRGEMASASRTEPFARFRQLVREVTQGSRAFLIILDTMEVVQYDPASIAGVVEFVSELNGGDGPDDFNELKIVACGRADVPQLRTEDAPRAESRKLELRPLIPADARGMAANVGKDLMKDAWNPVWADLVAGQPTDPETRREPLVLRVAVELLQAAKPEEREALAQSIANEGENADEGFVGRLYERRILDHIRDPDAKKIAWPGLIVRYWRQCWRR